MVDAVTIISNVYRLASKAQELAEKVGRNREGCKGLSTRLNYLGDILNNQGLQGRRCSRKILDVIEAFVENTTKYLEKLEPIEDTGTAGKLDLYARFKRGVRVVAGIINEVRNISKIAADIENFHTEIDRFLRDLKEFLSIDNLVRRDPANSLAQSTIDVRNGVVKETNNVMTEVTNGGALPEDIDELITCVDEAKSAILYLASVAHVPTFRFPVEARQPAADHLKNFVKKQIDDIRTASQVMAGRAKPSEPTFSGSGREDISRLFEPCEGARDGKLGEAGAFGATYKRRYRRTGVVFALKEINVEHARRFRMDKDRLRLEAETLQKISHVNVVRCYHSFFSDDGVRFFLVLELVDGLTLDQVLRTSGYQPHLPQLAKWLQQLARALVHMHEECNVIHRDLKPDNVMVTRGLEDIKIIDFGMARFLPAADVVLTAGMGTPFYMSWAKKHGEKYDGRDDVWAVGCMMLELLLGESMITHRPLCEDDAARANLLLSAQSCDARLGSLLDIVLARKEIDSIPPSSLLLILVSALANQEAPLADVFSRLSTAGTAAARSLRDSESLPTPSTSGKSAGKNSADVFKAELVQWLLDNVSAFTDDNARVCADKCLELGCNTVEMLGEEYVLKKQEGENSVDAFTSSLVNGSAPLKRKLCQTLDNTFCSPSVAEQPSTPAIATAKATVKPPPPGSALAKPPAAAPAPPAKPQTPPKPVTQSQNKPLAQTPPKPVTQSQTKPPALASASASAPAPAPAAYTSAQKQKDGMDGPSNTPVPRTLKNGNGSVSKIVLAWNLFLYTLRHEDPLTMIYEVQCTSVNNVRFTLNIDGSANFRLARLNARGQLVELPLAEKKLTVTITPFNRTEIGRVVIVDEEQRATLRTGCTFVMEEPDLSELRKHALVQNAKIQRMVNEAIQMQFPSQSVDDRTHQMVIERCQTYSKSFIDTTFPPCGSSLAGRVAGNEVPQVEWKRLSDIFGSSLFGDSISPNDLQHGALGDHWFLCALAALSEYPALVEAIFPLDTRKAHKCDVYTVRICKSGQWTDVRIDGFVPCYPGAGPIFSRACGDSMWVCLLEKAYAKLHGNYFAIRTGWTLAALMDLTGAPSVSSVLETTETQSQVRSGEFWAKLVRYMQKKYLVVVATPGENLESSKRGVHSETGLMAGCAYAVLAVASTSDGHQLVLLRNPWRVGSYTGDWSDESPHWTAKLKEEVQKHRVGDNEATFWMSLDEVFRYFYSLNVCLTRFPGISRKPWKESRRQFFFDYVASEDGASDGSRDGRHQITYPMYLLSLRQKGIVIAGVHQEDVMCEGAPAYLDIGVSILRVDPTHGTYSLVTGAGNAVVRQIQTEELELSAGRYLIVPTTSGGKLMQHIQESDARAAAAIPTAVTRVSADGDVQFSEAVIKIYSDMFRRMDVDGDGLLNKAEMDAYMMRTEGSPIENAAFAWLLASFEAKGALGLSLSGFLRAQLYVFRQTGSNEEKLRNEFVALGFHSVTLEPHTCRRVALSIHSTADFSLETLPYDESACTQADEQVVVQKGERQDFEKGTIRLYKLRSLHGVSLLVENVNNLTLVFEMDCSASENVISHRDSLVYRAVVGSNQRVVLHHLMPEDSKRSAWSWSYKASYYWEDD